MSLVQFTSLVSPVSCCSLKFGVCGWFTTGVGPSTFYPMSRQPRQPRKRAGRRTYPRVHPSSPPPPFGRECEVMSGGGGPRPSGVLRRFPGTAA